MKNFSLRALNPITGLLLILLASAVGTQADPAPDPLLDLAPEVRSHRDQARDLGIFRDRDRAVLGRGLSARVASGSVAGISVWVYFTDKGIGTRESLDRSLELSRDGLSDRARRRREALGADLGMDYTDLPVHRPYVERLRGSDFEVHRVSRWLNAVSVRTTIDRLPDLERLGFVRHIQPVLIGRKPPEPVVDLRASRGLPVSAQSGDIILADSVELALYGPSFGQLNEIQVIEMHRLGYTGAGVTVMVLDTGFKKDHPAFGCANLIAEWDFVNEDGDTQNELGDPSSSQSHGTGTWGVLGGYDPGNLVGAAFAADIVLAKTEDVSQEVHAEEDNYVAALEWGDSLGVDVASASLAYLGFDDSTAYSYEDLDGNTAAITVAVDIAASKGIACVNATGNSGPDPSSLWTPSDADSIISVGAVDSLGVIAGFSGRGPTADNRIKPEIVARGVRTWWARALTDGYGPASGTSLSTPLIGGLAALLKEAQPGWTGVDIRAALMGSGSLSGAPDNNMGWGIACGLDATTFGGAVPEPPRMTLPFRLLSPATESLVTTVTPALAWTTSEVVGGGAPATYHVLMDSDSSFSSADTIYSGPDTTYTFVLAIAPGETRWWTVEAVGDQGYARKSMNTHSFTVPAVLATDPGVTPTVSLMPAYPNPMRASTSFAIHAPEGEAVTLEIVSVSGRLIRRFEFTGSGRAEVVEWDGRDLRGSRVSAGVYFYRLASSSALITRRLVKLP